MFKFKSISQFFFSSIIGLVVIPLVANAEINDTETNNTFETSNNVTVKNTQVTGTVSPLVFVNNAPVSFTIPNLEPSEMFLAWTDNSFSGIDTLLGTFDESLNLIDFGDNGSPAGNEYGSVITGRVNSDGTINLGVTGYPDVDFVGNTPDEGEFELFVKLGTHEFTDLEDEHGEHDENDDDPLADYRTEDGYYDHIHGPTVDLDDFDYSFAGEIVQDDRIPGTLDFYTFENLTPGEVLMAEITQGDIDSILGLFDDEGNLVYADDDDGVDGLSLIPDILVPESGAIHLAVSGYPDFQFIGRHLEDGDYVLTLEDQDEDLVPEPLTILGTGFVFGFLPIMRKISLHK
jgi:hypothetical protein